MALVAMAVTPPSAYATGQDAGTPAAGPATQPTNTRTVTLITGDKVTVRTLADGRSAASIQRPKTLTGTVQTQTVGKDLYVYPSEALPYLAAGVLDQRLFDVTRLIADGYDDAHTSDLPLIVQYGGGATTRGTTPAPAGLTAGRDLPAIHGQAAKAVRSKAADFWQDVTPKASLTRARAVSAARNAARTPQALAKAGSATTVFAGNISHIWLDGKVKASLADSTAQIGAPDVWNTGTDGKGVNVAVLDTGVDAQHPDFAGQIADSQSFVPGEDTTDRHGHGTHTASTVAGTGAASGGKEKGVAPGAHLLIGKVLGDDGSGADSWIIAGMQWAAETQHAKVVSMSLGSDEVSDGTDPMSQAVNDLSASTGALFVIAAGNAGPGGIGSPGAATSALTVGAVDSGDNLAYFSSWGPRYLDGGLKPELTAPGVDILAARSQYTTEGSGSYLSMSGTSMATPHVAGAAALVAQQHPDWTGQQIKDALVSTAHETPGIPLTQGGAGRVDAKAAVLGTVSASDTAWSGFYAWPHTADQPSVKTITYTNTGGSDVTLNLAAKAADADGNEAAAGVFTLSASTVTVPAHGTAQVSVTGNPAAAAYGATDGLVEATAADGTVVAHTLIGLDREDERYNLTIKATDRSGAPIPGVAVVYRTGDQYASPVQLPESGQVTLHLPKGEYSVVMYADLPGAGGPDDFGLGVLSAPQVDLDRSREADLDARQAHQVSSVAPQRTEDLLTRVEWSRTTSDGAQFAENVMLPLSYTSVWAQSTAKVTNGSFNFVTRWRKTAPMLTLDATQPRFPDESFPDLVIQAGSPLLPAGDSRLDVVYAGRGTAADYAGLNAKGKAVVVSHDRQGDFLAQAQADAAQAAAAAAAGAKLLLVVNDSADRLSEWFGADDFESDGPIPVASLQPNEGASLISATTRPGLKLAVTSAPSSPYVYDLVERHDGAVPAADLTYRPSQSDLARYDERFAGSADQPGYNGRYDMEDFDQYGVFFDTVQQLGTTRTDWVTPGAGKFSWYEQSGITDVVEERAPLADPGKGSRTANNWFSPVIHPRLGDSILPNRQGDGFSINVPAWGDAGAGHTGYDYGDWGVDPDQLHETVSLYQGDTLVKSTDHQQLNIFGGVSPDRLPYRLVAETSQSTVFPTTSATRTEWDFTSGNDYVDLPLIQLDYGVATDPAGNAARSTTLTLAASHMPGVTGAGKINGTTLAVSFDDGSTWTPATLHKAADGSWSTEVKAPGSARYVSLRATAKDDQGNTVSQTVLRAFGVK
ncbi:S8 family serine peptidase [Peterkaempfera sp. SMS 1(5)a]|uniref:S8 family serine peptidase n=1 Tax=Peterkaempfera podocarpi TaxID=3232308 RepID=UPI003671BF3F